jgi:hypothetical protein
LTDDKELQRGAQMNIEQLADAILAEWDFCAEGSGECQFCGCGGRECRDATREARANGMSEGDICKALEIAGAEWRDSKRVHGVR